MESENNQPCLDNVPQKLYEFNAKYFQTRMGQLHVHVINIAITIYRYCFILQVPKIKYSRPTFMGFKMAHRFKCP